MMSVNKQKLAKQHLAPRIRSGLVNVFDQSRRVCLEILLRVRNSYNAAHRVEPAFDS